MDYYFIIFDERRIYMSENKNLNIPTKPIPGVETRSAEKPSVNIQPQQKKDK